VLTFSEPGEEPLVCLLPLGDSRGGDGILANKDIRTIADLKGKSVAFLHGSISEFYLNVLLKEVGLTEADLEVVDLSPDDAAEAFMMREVDAAVTYDPALTRAKHTAHGHLLTDTSERPGLLGDCLMAEAGVFRARKQDFKAVARAWAAAVEYVKAHPEEANAIMARSLGGWLEDPALFAEILKGVWIYDAKASRAYLGTPQAPGPIYDTMQYGIDVMSSLGWLKVKLKPADVIAHGIFGE
jgi:NitT/TauT family transport system substrate-binding protein